MKGCILTLFVVTCFFGSLHAQRTLESSRPYKETALTIGYNFNPASQNVEDSKGLHFLELGLWRTHVLDAHHPVSAAAYVANDFGLNTDDFVIGPKIGGFVSFWMFLALGAEVCYYTDFDSGSLRVIPSLGLFSPKLKLTFNPHIIINNKDFQHFGNGHINLTIRVFKLNRTYQ